MSRRCYRWYIILIDLYVFTSVYTGYCLITQLNRSSLVWSYWVYNLCRLFLKFHRGPEFPFIPGFSYLSTICRHFLNFEIICFLFLYVVDFILITYPNCRLTSSFYLFSHLCFSLYVFNRIDFWSLFFSSSPLLPPIFSWNYLTPCSSVTCWYTLTSGLSLSLLSRLFINFIIVLKGVKKVFVLYYISTFFESLGILPVFVSFDMDLWNTSLTTFCFYFPFNSFIGLSYMYNIYLLVVILITNWKIVFVVSGPLLLCHRNFTTCVCMCVVLVNSWSLRYRNFYCLFPKNLFTLE